jgi:hypothetical protein
MEPVTLINLFDELKKNSSSFTGGRKVFEIKKDENGNARMCFVTSGDAKKYVRVYEHILFPSHILPFQDGKDIVWPISDFVAFRVIDRDLLAKLNKQVRDSKIPLQIRINTGIISYNKSYSSVLFKNGADAMAFQLNSLI